MSDVKLIILPSPFLIEESVFPNLGVLYIASYLRENGIKVEIVDLHVEKEIKMKLEKGDIVGISSTTAEFFEAKKINDYIKNHFSQVTTVIGGAHATVAPQECQNFDCVVVGEGEEAMKEVVEGKRGLIIGKEIEDLDSLPFPARDLIDMKKYKYVIDGKRATSMITSRGCPFSCAFCCKTVKKVRFRSAQNINEEIREIKKLGYEGIMFYDDIFTLRSDLEEVCDYLKKQNMAWRCFIRASHITKEKLKLMKECGCREVGMGVESGSQEILNVINKKITIEQVKQVTKWCKELNLRIKHFYIIGLPGESKETIKKTENLIKETKPNDFDLTIFAPYPGSRIYEEKEKYDIDWKDYHLFYKGKPGKYITSIRTSKLNSNEIIEYRDRLESSLKKYLKCKKCN